MKFWTPRSYAVLIPRGELLEAVVMNRRAEGFERTLSATLRIQSNLLGDSPDVVGQELKDKLDEAGIHQRRWILAVPPSWILQQTVPFPPVQVDDDDEFFWLQAEQHLPIPADQCTLSISRFTAADGSGMATLFALNRDRYRRMHDVFNLAGLKLQAAVPAFLRAPGTEAAACLDPMASAVRLQVGTGGGFALLRELPVRGAAPTPESIQRLRQEVRIALASLPQGCRLSVEKISVCQERVADRSRALIGIWNGLEPDGEETSSLPPLVLESQPTANTEFIVQSAICSTDTTPFRPKTSQEQQQRIPYYSLRVALPIAALLVVLGCVIGRQAWTLRNLERRTAEIAPALAVVEDARSEVRSVAPWFDQRPVSLDILKAVTTCFPETGTVWLTRLRIGQGNAVELSGKATDPRAWLSMQKALRDAASIRDLRVSQTRFATGKSKTMTFTISFSWREGART